MVLGVLQTSNGARLASLDIDTNEDISVNLRKSSTRIDFVRPLSIDNSTARGKRMVAAYTAVPQTSENENGSDTTEKSTFSNTLAAISTVTASSMATVSTGLNAIKQILPHKTYKLQSGRKFSWPALSLSHAQLSNAVVIGLFIVGVGSFAFWMPADQADIAQTPPVVMGVNTSNDSQDSTIPMTNNSGNDASTSSWTSPSGQTPWLPTQATPTNTFAQPEELLPAQQAEPTTTPVIDPIQEIIEEPIVGADPPVEVPEIPIIPEVITPVTGTLENTLTTVTEISGSF